MLKTDMPKPKIYLDTSVISHLEQPEKPSEQAFSEKLFELIKDGEFDVYLSSVVFDEINNCPPEKREPLLEHVSVIKYQNIIITPEIENLAKKIIDKKVLSPKCVPDSQHIAAAVFAGCNFMLSWNMKHMSNMRINKEIRLITIAEGYKEIMLIPPFMLTEGRTFYD
jgi:predicted nucleic acid-binding protein